MKHKYKYNKVEHIHRNTKDIYNSRFDIVMTEISNYYNRTLETNEGSTVQLPTIVQTIQTKPNKKNIISHYVSSEPPSNKQFKFIYKNNSNLRNKIDEIKYSGNKLSLQDYHIKIV
jgi:hypothetical protein